MGKMPTRFSVVKVSFSRKNEWKFLNENFPFCKAFPVLLRENFKSKKGHPKSHLGMKIIAFWIS